MREIIISKEESSRVIALVENGNVLEKYEEHANQKRLEGNIYMGKVQNVLPGMQAAFVDIGENKNTFIHLRDILPKMDSKTEDMGEIIKKSDIKDVIKAGMPLMVQIKRDSTNKKGARVSTHISIPTRFIVFMPNTEFITVSQKIEREEEKQRLTKIVKEFLPNKSGAIIRTSAEGKSQEEIQRDIKEVISQWENINKVADNKKMTFPRLLYKSESIIEKFLRDIIDQDIQKIIVNEEQEFQTVCKTLEVTGYGEKIEVVLKKEDILQIYNIREQIEELQNRKIWLKCGGFITIDKTEALIAIDVNSGKYIGNKNLEQTVFKVNKEASVEIARQLKLRDIGGIIIIDYIDMQEEENKKKIIEILEEHLKKDRSKTQVLGFTKLNLLEMTRKHMCSND